MKVAVYAIALNECKFVERFVRSMAEADLVVIADTGSTDGTQAAVKKLSKAKLTHVRVTPWRFDDARNAVLATLPDDIDVCISMDLDEVLNRGWRGWLEAAWPEPKLGVAVQGSFTYNWSHNEDSTPGVQYQFNKVHSRHGWRWRAPVHEVLVPDPRWPLESVTIDGMIGDHWPDPTKGRGFYLPLLELAVAENPTDDRMCHYLGREYFFHRNWLACFATLQKHLDMPQARFAAERAASLRYMAKACVVNQRPWDAVKLLHRAVAEAPELREARLDLADLYVDLGYFEDAMANINNAMAQVDRPSLYLVEPESYGARPESIRQRILLQQSKS